MKDGGGLADVFNQASSVFGWFNPFAMFSAPTEPPPAAATAKPPAAAEGDNTSGGGVLATVDPSSDPVGDSRLAMRAAQGVMQPYAPSNSDPWEAHIKRTVAPIEKRIGGKKALSPIEADLLTDKYAPRAFADFSRNLSSTFAQVVSSGSYVGSPPRIRDKPIVSYEGALAGDKFHRNRKMGPSPTHVAHRSSAPDSPDIATHGTSADNENCGPWEVKSATGKHFLKDDPWESH